MQLRGFGVMKTKETALLTKQTNINTTTATTTTFVDADCLLMFDVSSFLLWSSTHHLQKCLKDSQELSIVCLWNQVTNYDHY